MPLGPVQWIPSDPRGITYFEDITVNDDFHPDDAEAHKIIKRLTGIPDGAQLSNTRAMRHLFKYFQDGESDMTDEEDTLLRGWLKL